MLRRTRTLLPEVRTDPASLRGIPTDTERCSSTFPNCKAIRCQKRIHDPESIHRAANRKPYYAVFWEEDNEQGNT